MYLVKFKNNLAASKQHRLKDGGGAVRNLQIIID